MKANYLLIFVLSVFCVNQITAQTYTLTDDDVVVEDGVIQSCSYDFELTDIIIPENLDGQTVVGIADAKSNVGIFEYKGITSVELPSTIAYIGKEAFSANSITSLDLSGNINLHIIKQSAFLSNDIASLDLSGCTLLDTVESYAFKSNKLDTVTFAGCSSLKYIGYESFRSNVLRSLDLHGCSSLVEIYSSAFRYNQLSSLDLSECTSLLKIGDYAFDSNRFYSTGFALPIVSGKEQYGWKNGLDHSFMGGDVITEYNTYYWVPEPYTLTDDDVIVENGYIDSCIYDFELTDIIIPENLDGQTVVGISDAKSNVGIFEYKGITSVILPSSIAYIGQEAFSANSITSLDLSGNTNLHIIKQSAFLSNDIASLDLSGCTLLDTVESYAFKSNKLDTVTFAGCSSLKYIGYESFRSNVLRSLDLHGCTSLVEIYSSAFRYNQLSSLDLSECTSLLKIGDYAFDSNRFYSTGFALPIVSGKEQYGWKNGLDHSFMGGDVTTEYNTYYWVPEPYTLTDDDVIVENGYIDSCIYDFELTDIIIPEILDGQEVIGIADAKEIGYYLTGVFENKGITSVELPATIEFIGREAFSSNSITSLDLSGNDNLRIIKYLAFSSNDLNKLNLSGCSTLDSIENYAFKSNQLDTVRLSGCTSLKNIGYESFSSNQIKVLDLTGCSALKKIDANAFRYNQLSSLDLSGCTSLVEIGDYAFDGNRFYSTGFALPVVSGKEQYGWKNGLDHSFMGGDVTTEYNTYYWVPEPYTLTDEDVIVENGYIDSCTYDFEYKDIIIPEILDGQEIIGIADAKEIGYYLTGVFENKGITSVELPATIEYIGREAFSSNSITSLDLSGNDNLRIIKYLAFSSNDLNKLNLSGCSTLDSIENYAFKSNQLDTVRLSGCTSLKNIGYESFSSNQIKALDLTGCSALKKIEGNAFRYNQLSSIDLSECTSLVEIGDYAFNNNRFYSSGFALPVVSGKEQYGWSSGYGISYSGGDVVKAYDTYYWVPVPYTLTDDDVEVVNGFIDTCTYSFEYKDIIIPEILDNQVIKGISDAKKYGYYYYGVFENKGIRSVDLPKSISHIGTEAFYGNSIVNLDLSDNTNLKKIENSAFYYNDINKLELSGCSALDTIGNYAFKTNQIRNVYLSGCTALKYMGIEAFYSNSIDSVFLDGCNSLKQIDKYAFYYNSLEEVDLSSCSELIRIGEYAFSQNRLYSGIVLPSVTDKEQYGWRSGTNKYYTAGDAVSNFETFYWVPEPYTLTDDDVVVENGIIKSCSYNFELTDIIIPEILDDFTVIGISDGIDYNTSSGIFSYKKITSIHLPHTINYIGRYAFHYNNIVSLAFENCIDLNRIGYGAFRYNQVVSVDFTDCPNLETIEDIAFDENKTDSVIISACTKLKSIGREAFSYYRLTYVDLSGCSSLSYIGSSAFSSSYLDGFNLPDPIIPGYFYSYWNDSGGNLYNAGDKVSNLSRTYTRVMPEVEDLSPKFVPVEGNVEVTLFGKNFENQRNEKTVQVNGVDAISYSLWNDTTITFVCPPNSEGFKDIEIVLQNELKYTAPKQLLYTSDNIVEICGEISGTWVKGNTYFLTCDAEVPAGKTLTIEPGVLVLADHNNQNKPQLLISGTLNCHGNKQDTIQFLTFAEGKENWEGIVVDGEINLSYSSIQNAKNGIYQDHGNININNNLFANNAYGVYISASNNYLNASIDSCAFENNNTGLQLESWGNQSTGNLTIEINNTVIKSNELYGIYAQSRGYTSGWSVPISKSAYMSLTLNNSVISNNGGKAIYLYSNGYDDRDYIPTAHRYGNLDFYASNCIIANNSGAIWAQRGNDENCTMDLTIQNSNFWENSLLADMDADKIFFYNSSLWDNGLTAGPTGVCDSLTFDNCNVNNTAIVENGENNISFDPEYISTESGNFNLSEESPNIDVGNNEYVLSYSDIEHKARIWDGDGDGTATVDIGAFEYGSIFQMAPEIVRQPVGGTYCPGSRVELTVVVNAYPQPDYQWYWNDSPIVGINDNTFVIEDLNDNKIGEFTCVITNSLGTVTTETAIVNVSPEYNISEEAVICKGEYFEYNGNFYTRDTTFIQNLNTTYGCDSIITTVLSVQEPYEDTEYKTICEGEEYKGLSETGVYTDSLKTTYGCDSILTTVLTVNHSYDVYNDIILCEGDLYNGASTEGWNRENLIVDSYTTVNGCDSTVTTNVVVNPRPGQPVITQDADTLSTVVAEHYTWYLDYVPIVGADSRELVIDVSGYYQVALENEYGCVSDLSEPLYAVSTSKKDVGSFKSLQVYPNPTNGKVTVKGFNQNKNTIISVFDDNGKLIIKKIVASTSVEIDLSRFASGIYHLTVIADDNLLNYQIVKK